MTGMVFSIVSVLRRASSAAPAGGKSGGEEFIRFLPVNLDLSSVAGRERLALLLPLFLIAVALVKGAAYFGQFFLMGITGQRVIRDLRRDLHAHLTALSLPFLRFPFFL